MTLETAEHKKRKAECLSVIEAVSALCLMEMLGIFDLDEEELGVCLGFAAIAFESMASLPRNLEPIDPFTTKDDLQFEGAFRFTKQAVLRLVPCLRLPLFIFVPKLRYVPILTALMVLLHRLHNPVTFIDMEETFGIPWYNLSRICTVMVNYVYELFIFRLAFDTVLLRARAAMYAAAISRKCAGALHTCVGFLDGTLRQQCRPVRGQRAIFSGHKRHHGLKFQTLTLPDGLETIPGFSAILFVC